MSETECGRFSTISRETISNVERQLSQPPSVWLNLTGKQKFRNHSFKSLINNY